MLKPWWMWRHMLFYNGYYKNGNKTACLVQNSVPQTLTYSSLLSPPFHNTTVCCIPVSPLHPTYNL